MKGRHVKEAIVAATTMPNRAITNSGEVDELYYLPKTLCNSLVPGRAHILEKIGTFSTIKINLLPATTLGPKNKLNPTR